MSASTFRTEPSRAIVEAAVAWHMRLCEKGAGDAEREACLRWRSEDVAHELAYTRIESLWRRFDDASESPARVALNAGLSVRKPGKAKRLATSLALAVFAMCGLIAFNQIHGGLSPSSLLADYSAGAGEQKVVALADGSRLILNSRSAADVDYDTTQRRIVVRAGEVLVEVARDAERPFIVETPQGTAQALGTRYLVRRTNEETTDVTVLESVVRSCAQAASACQVLQAGHRVRMDAQGVHGPVKTDTVAAEAWRSGTLLVDDRPLAEVLDELARYRKGWLRYDAASVAGLRVSGVFPLNNTDEALAVLASTQALTIEHYGPWVVSIKRH